MKTLNKAVARYNGISLIVRILIGLIIGAVLALVAPGAGWVGELGSLFVGALKGIAPVLVFVIVASALAQGSSKLDRRFGTVIWLALLWLAAAKKRKLNLSTLQVTGKKRTLAMAIRLDISRMIKSICSGCLTVAIRRCCTGLALMQHQRMTLFLIHGNP